MPELDAAAERGWPAIFASLQPDHPLLVQIIGVKAVRPPVADLVDEIESLGGDSRLLQTKLPLHPVDAATLIAEHESEGDGVARGVRVGFG